MPVCIDMGSLRGFLYLKCFLFYIWNLLELIFIHHNYQQPFTAGHRSLFNQGIFIYYTEPYWLEYALSLLLILFAVLFLLSAPLGDLKKDE